MNEQIKQIAERIREIREISGISARYNGRQARGSGGKIYVVRRG